MTDERAKTCFGIVGGLGPLAGADIFMKLVRSTPALSDRDHFGIVFEQHPLDDGQAVADAAFNANARKFHVYNTIKSFEARAVDRVILPCFISHSFLGEIASEVKPKVIDMMAALRRHVAERHGSATKLGVLTSSYLRRKALFEQTFAASGQAIVHPTAEIQEDCLMAAVYGPGGIKAGQLGGRTIDLIERAVVDLIAQGAELILPGFTEIPIVLESLRPRVDVPIVDSNQVYVDDAIADRAAGAERPFRIGVIGGVGPAATVDFMDKVIRNTAAQRDQDHIKMVVEHNPQIPDRTENLIAEGPDPTIPLYAAGKTLERQGADLIAIPCNTAHAFVERIQGHLAVPIVNMLDETVRAVERLAAGRRAIGLLATAGTVRSRVYHQAFAATGCDLIVPDESRQDLVMRAIYGEEGVKAGHRDGRCRDDLLAALAHLVQRGAEIVILGCTELPLILPQCEGFEIAGKRVALLDPTEILARRCVALARRYGPAAG